MDLIVKDQVTLGVCLNLSESGLRGSFSSPVPLGATGLLTLYQNDRSFQAHAEVESIHGEEARVRFLFESDQELDAIRVLLKSLPENSRRL